MRNISAWAIKHPIFPIVLFVVLAFVGTVAFIRLPINLNPDISFPQVLVQVSQPGAAPTEMETQVMQKIEGAVASVGNVHNITSRAVEGTARIWIEFQIGTPIDRAVSDVRDAVARVRSELPEGIQEPSITRQDGDGGPIAYYAVSTTSMTPEQLSWFVDSTVTKRLLAVPGVAQVGRSGGVDREIRVELDPARMQALGITAVQVNQQLRALNLDAPGGRLQVAGGEQSIRVLGGARTANALGATQITVAGGRVARLDDIAEVHDGVAEIRTLSRLDGRPATTFFVTKARGYSDVSTKDKVDREIHKILDENPGVSVTEVFTTVEHTKRAYRSAVDALLEGSILAVAVVFLFLREWRATAISALAIPLSAIPTFAFMSWMDFTLNGVSLLALSLVAGVLVDDAIVEIENIVRHIRMGKKPYQAALDAADEIGLAVVATSATIIAVFLPVSFMGGISGQYFKQFGLTVAAAVFFSLLVARLVTPVLAAFTLKPEGTKPHLEGALMRRYLGWLRTCVKHRWKALGFAALFFIGSVALLGVIPKAFIPPEDLGASQVNIELPPGVRLEDTARVSAQAADILRRHKEVASIVESVGSDEDGQVRTANLFISLVPKSQRKLSQKDWEDQVAPELRKIADAHVEFQSQQGFNGRDFTLFITGDDPVAVDAAARNVVDAMRGLKEIRDPRIDGDMPRPEIVVRPRFDVAAELGVTVQSISQTVRIATLGDIPQNVAKFSLSDRQVPIRVSLKESSREDLATLENLPVPTANGGSVPLKAVAELSFGQGPATVRRYNQSRRLMIGADLAPGVQFGDAQKKIDALPALKNLPPGVHSPRVGTAEFMEELFTNFLLAVGAGVLMVFAVLVLLFARVFQPVTILSALPLALGGAVLALMIFNIPFSMSVIIGILMLMGIVAKNSILLVDFAIEEMRAGRDKLGALAEAGHKRAQPIVMTSVAMIAGMLPTALGIGDASSFRQPMAVAVIGGIITSTFLTLVIVPAAFSVIDDIERWVGPRFARALTHEHHVEPHLGRPAGEPVVGGLAPGRAQRAPD
ncbi:MAG TPA: efflux RND transporter permease subunit [Steroidobacteraceae bacterium]|nr:efflux RND transporter permease subunit [Steroidobacteraceae bacterium]